MSLIGVILKDNADALKFAKYFNEQATQCYGDLCEPSLQAIPRPNIRADRVLILGSDDDPPIGELTQQIRQIIEGHDSLKSTEYEITPKLPNGWRDLADFKIGEPA